MLGFVNGVPVTLVSLCPDYSFVCAGCGVVLDNCENMLWEASHVGRQNKSFLSSAGTMGIVVTYHCRDCDPSKTRIAWLRAEAERLERGEYPSYISPLWDAVQGK